MRNIPTKLYTQIQQAILEPIGTLSLNYTCEELFNENNDGGILIQVPSREKLIRLERDQNMNISFYHSTPGTGTRVATINLKDVPQSNKVKIVLTWSPEEINLHLGPLGVKSKLFTAKGQLSKRQFIVGKDGGIYQIGDQGIDVMQVEIYKDGIPVVQPNALAAWKNTLKSIEILSAGQSGEGYIFESVVTNLSIVILMTGFEAYTKKRFLEIEKEGVNPDIDSLLESFLSRKEKEADLDELIKVEAKDSGITVLEALFDRNSINFQNYDQCKKAYNKAYNIKFGEIGLDSNKLEKIQKIINYRHRIIHVSPLLGTLNQPNIPREEPVFANKELSTEAVNVFDEFVNKLHTATLKIEN